MKVSLVKRAQPQRENDRDVVSQQAQALRTEGFDNRPEFAAQRQLINQLQHAPLVPARSSAKRTSGIDKNALVQRKIYIGRGAKDPIAEDSDTANKLRADAKKDPYPSYFPHMILEPALTEWENPVRAARQQDVLPMLVAGTPSGDELQDSFREGDKLYGMEKARKGHTQPRGRKGIGTPHPTVDSMNNALGVGQGGIRIGEKLDEETANYGVGLKARSPDLSSKDSNVNFKEACKKAVEYITKDTDGFIHFELDKLDVAAVVTKKFDSITGAELRKIFREVVRAEWATKHRQERESRLDLSKIRFYMKGAVVDAPWVQEPELWREYKEHRVRARDRHFGVG